MIRLISIKNFRSIASQAFKAEEITTFVGRNDAGKSNVLRALNLFFNGQTDHNQSFNFESDHNKYAPKYNQRAQEIVIELALKLPKSYRKNLTQDHVYWKKVWREEGVRNDYEESGLCTIRNNQIQKRSKGFPSRSKIPNLLNAIDFEYIPATKDWNYFQNLQIKLYDSLANFSDQGLHQSASSFEEEINTHVQELTQAIDDEFSGSNVVKLPKNLRNIFGALEFNSDEIPLTRRGDGIKIRHIPMILSFIASRKQKAAKRNTIKPQIWAFEEPENNVEFLSCFELNRQLIEAAKNYTQILITTHSPAIYSIGSSDKLPSNVKTTSYYVGQQDNATFVNQTEEKALHGNMGFLQLIAPIVEEKRKEWDQREKEYIQAQLKLKTELSKTKLPHLFLEGKSDKKVFSRLLEAKGIAHMVHIFVPSDASNSANSAADRLQAFYLLQKHEKPKNKLQALIILDNDDAGKKASATLDDAVASKHIKRFLLKPNDDLKAMFKVGGLNINTDLERLMPSSLWQLAKTEGWVQLVEDCYEKLTDVGRKKICNGNISFNDLIGDLSEHQTDLLNYQFTDEGKEAISNHIECLEDGEVIDELLHAFKEPLGLIENFLLVSTTT
ncbi:AAA family ATPase [Vibrio parahaemolyticus]|nr:AAA family ATPase [Vibrio parahaemolyticus]